MTLWMQNVAVYSLQVAILALAGVLAAQVFRLKTPGPRLLFWQALLCACVVLPFAQPWKRAAAAAGDVSISLGAAVIRQTAPPRWNISLEETVFAILTAGIALRLAWLAAGFWRLDRLRRAATPLDPPPAAAAAMGVDAAVYLSADIAGPVAFGVLHPAVLLPERFLTLEPAQQRAVMCHELLHIRRRDTLALVAEELVRAVLWFHPAVWWMLGQIHLTREQAVDREAVRLTESRQDYLAALLSMAEAKLRLDLAPAPLFLKQRHLAQRVASILKEVNMSKRRLIASLAAMFVLVAAAGRLAVIAFPLQAPAQEAAQHPRLLHKTQPGYPPAAKERRIEGTVTMEILIDAKGTVIDARALSGPEDLRGAALRAVLDWHFANDSGKSVKATVETTFRLGPDKPAFTAEVKQLDRGRVKSIQIDGVSDAAKEALLRGIPVREGDLLTGDMAERVTKAVREVDDHLGVVYAAVEGGTAIRIGLRAEAPVERVRVGGNAQALKLVEKIRPVYPPLAKQSRTQGKVTLNVIIAKDGHAREVNVITGDEVLAAAAVEAVKQWVWSTTLLNGNPVEVQTQVDVNFTLAQ